MKPTLLILVCASGLLLTVGCNNPTNIAPSPITTFNDESDQTREGEVGRFKIIETQSFNDARIVMLDTSCGDIYALPLGSNVWHKIPSPVAKRDLFAELFGTNQPASNKQQTPEIKKISQ